MVKTEELRNMTNEELMQLEYELKHKLFNLRFQHALGKLDDTSQIKKCKKDIARVLTILRERGIKR